MPAIEEVRGLSCSRGNGVHGRAANHEARRRHGGRAGESTFFEVDARRLRRPARHRGDRSRESLWTRHATSDEPTRPMRGFEIGFTDLHEVDSGLGRRQICASSAVHAAPGRADRRAQPRRSVTRQDHLRIAEFGLRMESRGGDRRLAAEEVASSASAAQTLTSPRPVIGAARVVAGETPAPAPATTRRSSSAPRRPTTGSAPGAARFRAGGRRKGAA